MRRQNRSIPTITALVAVCLAAGAAPATRATPAAAAAAAGSSPNVVLIFCDDAGYAEFGYTGATVFETPHIDALAATSARFHQAYVTAPICTPSRAALLTGRYQSRFGVEHGANMDPANPWWGLPADEVSIMKRLGDLGYVTGVIGKWHLGAEEGVNTPADHGADEFFGFLGGHRSYYGGESDPYTVLRRGNRVIESDWVEGGDPAEYDPTYGRYLTDAFGDEAADFISRHAPGASPFFLYLAFSAMHSPLEAKQQDLDAFPELTGVRLLRAGMMLAMDRAVGRVLDAIDANGVADETIVVFMNDNGGMLDEGADNGTLRGGKGTMYEGGIRVPFLVRMPGAPGGRDIQGPVISTDVVPTIIAAAGGGAGGFDGIDLMPHILGIEPLPDRALYWRQWTKWAVRVGDWKLTRTSDPISNELFDLSADPGETTDLAASQPAIFDDLVREFTGFEARCPRPLWAPGVAIHGFDRFRNAASPGWTNWRAANAWNEGETSRGVTLHWTDGYAGTILEFPVEAYDYVAMNDAVRMSSLEFMVNGLELGRSTPAPLTPHATPSWPPVGRLTGGRLLLAGSLTGERAFIRIGGEHEGLGRTGDLRSPPFVFDVALELALLGDLVIEGDGPASVLARGPVREYRPGSSLTKRGGSRITFANDVELTGRVRVEGGRLSIGGLLGRLTGPRALLIDSDGVVALEDYRSIEAEHVCLSGLLEGVGTVIGSFANDGCVAPGAPTGRLAVDGSYEQASGRLEIDIGGPAEIGAFDRLCVTGTAALGGTIAVDLVGGYVPSEGEAFPILCAGAVDGSFDQVILPPGFIVAYEPTAVVVSRGPPGAWACNDLAPCFGDVDGDRIVGFQDLLMILVDWGPCVGCPADLDGNGVVGFPDLLTVLVNWGPCIDCLVE